MAKLKYYRYALKEEGKFPKKNFVRLENPPDGYWGSAVYNTLLPDQTVKKYCLVDLNDDVSHLARLRILAGIKQGEAAEKLGVPLRTLQGWEMGGIGSANLTNSIKLADLYGVKDLRDLMG